MNFLWAAPFMPLDLCAQAANFDCCADIGLAAVAADAVWANANTEAASIAGMTIFFMLFPLNG